MLSPSAFHHLAIQVNDLRAAEDFYCGVLGLRISERWPWPDGRPGERSLWVALGVGFLALEACVDEPGHVPFKDGRAGLHLIALRIEAGERAAWERHLAARGVTVVNRSRFTLYVQDPEGNRVGLSHYPYEA